MQHVDLGDVGRSLIRVDVDVVGFELLEQLIYSPHVRGDDVAGSQHIGTSRCAAGPTETPRYVLRVETQGLRDTDSLLVRDYFLRVHARLVNDFLDRLFEALLRAAGLKPELLDVHELFGIDLVSSGRAGRDFAFRGWGSGADPLHHLGRFPRDLLGRECLLECAVDSVVRYHGSHSEILEATHERRGDSSGHAHVHPLDRGVFSDRGVQQPSNQPTYSSLAAYPSSSR